MHVRETWEAKEGEDVAARRPHIRRACRAAVGPRCDIVMVLGEGVVMVLEKMSPWYSLR